MLGSLTSVGGLSSRRFISGNSKALEIVYGNNNTSARFNGSSALLNSNNVSGYMNLSTTFTIEAYVYLTTDNNDQCIIGIGDNTSSMSIKYKNTWPSDNGNVFTFVVETNTGSVLAVPSTVPVYKNNWVHVAVTRDINNAIRIFVNGISNSQTISTVGFSGFGIAFGRKNIYTGSEFFTGNLSRIRISNTSYYSTNFIPTQAQFNHNSNDIGVWNFKNSTNWLTSENAALTMTNNSVNFVDIGPSTISAIKFANQVSWLSSTPIVPILGTGPYTLECFLRINGSYSTETPIGIFGIGSSTSGYSMSLVNGKLSLLNNLTPIYSDNDVFPGDTGWRHCAITRDPSGVVQIWINGNSKYSFVESPIVQLNNNNNIAIGRSYNNLNSQYLPINSEISKLRISNTNYYTSNFIPSMSTPYIVTSNDILVCEFRFFDTRFNTSGLIDVTLTDNRNSITLNYI